LTLENTASEHQSPAELILYTTSSCDRRILGYAFATVALSLALGLPTAYPLASHQRPGPAGP
jgi:hypothetical protein